MLEQGIQWNIVKSLLGYSSKSIRSETYFKMTRENIIEVIPFHQIYKPFFLVIE